MSPEKYQRVSNYIHRVIGGPHVLVSIGENIVNFNGYIQLNESAALIWDELSVPRTVEELSAKVCDEFNVSEKQAKADVVEFLELGVRNKMVNCCE